MKLSWALVLLLSLASAPAWADGDGKKGDDKGAGDEDAQAIERVLNNTKIDLDFTDASLEDVIGFVREYAKINMEFDAKLQEEGIPAKKISFQMKDALLRNVLTVMLRQSGLGYRIDKSVLRIVKIDDGGRPADDKKGDDKGAAGAADDAKLQKRIDNTFKRADAKGDGKLTFDEWPFKGKTEKDEFDRADTDHDGTVDKDEFAVHYKEFMARKRLEQSKHVMDRLDKDKDGKLGPDEWVGAAEDFKKVDKDSDGFVEAEELAAADLLFGLSRFTAMDKDGDGSIDKDEWAAGKGKPEAFDAGDADKDGKLTIDELPAAQKAMRGARKGEKDDDEKGDKDKGDKDGDGK